MRATIVSDLHLGSGNEEDLLRLPEPRRVLLEALANAETVVLLGDVIELRDRPLAEAFAIAAPFFRELGETLSGGRVVIVPGNHDHHLLDVWLQRRRLDGSAPLRLEERAAAVEGPARALGELMPEVELELAYPGIWLRPDVYATHGHYLDRHLTIPTFERLGVAAVERLLGAEPAPADPLEPPGRAEPETPDDYEQALAPVYAFLFALAQAGTRIDAASPSARIWAALSSGETRAARLRGWLLGAVALPGAVGVANRLGLGPVRPDLSPGAITRGGLAAMAEVIRRLELSPDHVIFGHTHRRGPLGGDDDQAWTVGSTRLLNTGSWVHSPSLLGRTAAHSPYWPGTVGLVGEKGPPQVVELLDSWSREQLAAGGR